MSPAEKDRSTFVCPKTGKPLKAKRKRPWLIWLAPISGLFALVWFLLRVVPKPSRAAYPCQRLAAPLASGFVVWLAALLGSILAYRKARHFLSGSRYVLASVFAALAVGILWVSLSVTAEKAADAAPFSPTDPPNSPIGQAKGIHPGRVVWLHDPAATSWDGASGSWWDDDNTDQEAVNYMVSASVRGLTGQSTDADAWDGLFRHFNQARGLGDTGYEQGEKVAVKINKNQDDRVSWTPGKGVPSPHVIYALIDQLINVAGVPGSAITVYDASRYIGDPIYDKIRSNPDANFQSVRFVVKSSRAGNGRIGATQDTANPLYTKGGTAYLPQCVTQAKYLINMALLRPHTLFGVTLCAKNHFGSTYFPSGGGWTPAPMHNYGSRNNPMGSYNCLVNLNGHRHLSGKTLLYMVDALYPAEHQGANVMRFLSFGDDWCSSIFASQDPVAIDSVGLDFLRSEPRCTQVQGTADNYLHEAALAGNPPSGTYYDPEGDGSKLASLGVHEHWNNSTDRQYSRNLGTGDGIELFIPSLTSDDGPVANLATSARYDYVRHALTDADDGAEIVVAPGIYRESISFNGKNLTVRSSDPSDPAVVAATIIEGTATAVTFVGAEDANCVLAGLTITGADGAIYCYAASPKIVNCRITANKGAAIELHYGSRPSILSCAINGNAGSGIEMWPKQIGRITYYNHPTISNCVISDNQVHGIYGGIPTITNCTIAGNGQSGVTSPAPTIVNSIVYGNGDGSASAQISGGSCTVTSCNVEGSWPGQANIEADPCFADPAGGDYHLKSEAGRWEPGLRRWVRDAVTSLCIDAGNPASDYTAELWPHGKRVNIGAYGATPQASMSLSPAGNPADLTNDGRADNRDFADLAANWLIHQVLLGPDLDRSGFVDYNDVVIFTDNWLWQAP